jgi:hypothetical protein
MLKFDREYLQGHYFYKNEGDSPNKVGIVFMHDDDGSQTIQSATFIDCNEVGVLVEDTELHIYPLFIPWTSIHSLHIEDGSLDEGDEE